MNETFAKKIQRKMGEAMRSTGRVGGKWQGRAYDHICLTIEDNFIDGKVPEKCSVKGSDTFEGKNLGNIKYHLGAAHLNSSQVVCISFFKKFFETEDGENLLLSLLRKNGVVIHSDRISNAIFEYEPDPDERTNFDFYMVMEDGQRISMEIKYTEAEFGGISPDKNDSDKYDQKWTAIYEKMVEDSPYIKCDQEEFYGNYQINRNIAHAHNGDAVIFLTPKANVAAGLLLGKEYIEKIHEQHPEVMNLYWEDLVADLMPQAKMAGPDFAAYYEKFEKKYIDVLKD